MKNFSVALLFLAITLSAQFAGGTGTELDPYQIETPEQLDNVRNYLTSSFILNNDIDLTDYLSPSGAGFNGGALWEPIGSSMSVLFSGIFDGNNYTIYGLQIDRSDRSTIGLFGYINEGTVKNLKLRKKSENEEIKSYYTDYVTYYNGSLAGYVISGDIINCSSDCNVRFRYGGGGLIGTMQTGTVTDSYFTGTVYSGNGSVGGIASQLIHAIIERCYTKAVIEVDEYFRTGKEQPKVDPVTEGCGGFAYNIEYSDLLQCFTECEIQGFSFAGGFTGFSENSNYNECYSKSDVYGDSLLAGFCAGASSGNAIYCYAAGRLVSANPNTTSGFNLPFLLSNYYEGFRIADELFWDTDLSGQLTSDQGIGKTTMQMKTPENYYDPIHHSRWDFDTPVWKIDPCKNDGYPYLAWYKPEVTFEMNGAGTLSDPLQIETPEQLDFVGNYVGGFYSPNYFKLMNDIDLTDYLSPGNPGYNDGMFWEPIGKSMSEIKVLTFRHFRAKFDGNGKKVTGLKINRPDSVCIGLFGKINEGAEIKNLQVYVDSTGTVLGKDSVGVIIGVNSNAIVENCIAYGNVSGDQLTGGMAGFMNSAQLTDSYSFADVSANTYAGGIIGKNQNGTVTRCYAAGPVSAIGDAGGLIAWNESANIIDCYWDVETSGQTTHICGTGLTTAEMKERLNYNNWFPSSAWDIHPLFNDGYPFLKYEDLEPYNPFASGTGTSGDPFQISTPDDLELVRLYEGSFSKGKYFKLMNDIDLLTYLAPSGDGYNNGSYWEPIGKPDSVFAGNFNGNSNKIRNLRINRPAEDYVGLYGYINEDALISYLEIVNNDSIDITGNAFVGSIAGVTLGDLTVCSSNSEVYGNEVAGGLIGYIDGGIINQCSSSGPVTGITGVGGFAGYMSAGLLYDSYSTGDATGDTSVGGLLGQVVYPSVLNNCYSSGTVTGNGYTGGLIGDSFYADITDCYWDVQSSGQTYSEEGVGKFTAEMTEQLTFSGWDFSTPVWNIDPGFNGGYPYLSWEAVIYYPQNLTMEFVGEDQVSLGWDAVTGATGYRIYGSNEPFGNFVLIADTTENLYNGTFSEDRYFYYVVAYNNEKTY